MADQKVKVLSSVPIVAIDGHGVGISQDKQSVNIQFLQITGQDPETSEFNANVVASARFTKEQIKNLQADINKAVAELDK